MMKFNIKILTGFLIMICANSLSGKSFNKSNLNVDPIDDIGKEIKHVIEKGGNHDYKVLPIDDIGKEIKHVIENGGNHDYKVAIFEVLIKGEFH